MKTRHDQAALKALFALAALSTLNPQLSTGFAQGSLNPPGPPEPTMKTLGQIEPRTPISSLPLVITNSGSYYFTTNLTGVVGTNGITVLANNVTVDLMGFTLFGVVGSMHGIEVPLFTTRVGNLTIRRGVVRDWGGDGLRIGTATNSVVSEVHVSNNGGDGLSIGRGGTVCQCVAVRNGGNGIRAIDESRVTGCSAFTNTTSGINVGDRCMVSQCLTSRNAGGNVSPGIVANDFCIITDCSSSFNGVGIQVAAACVVRNNHCSDNKKGFSTSGNGAGILIGFGAGSLFEGNLLVNNDVGIDTGSSDRNLIIRNSAINNVTNYLIAPGNLSGTIVTNQATLNSAPNANVNFQF